MKFTLPMLAALGVGTLLLWCGITDRNPLEVMKSALTGKGIPAKGSGSANIGATQGIGTNPNNAGAQGQSGFGPGGSAGNAPGGGGGGSF